MSILVAPKMIDTLQNEWACAADRGWWHANRQEWDKALEFYRFADEAAYKGRHVWGDSSVSPKLSLLRHRVGEEEGFILTPHPH